MTLYRRMPYRQRTGIADNLLSGAWGRSLENGSIRPLDIFSCLIVIFRGSERGAGGMLAFFTV